MRGQVRILIAAAAVVAACSRDRAPEPDDRTGAPGAPEGAVARAPSGPPLAEAPYYRLDAIAPAACVAGAACEAKLVLTATGGFHVNKDYPFKFIADAASDVTVEATAFAVDNAHTGTMTITLRPAKAGPAQVRGTFKLSVCDDDACKIEEPAVAIPTVVRSPAG